MPSTLYLPSFGNRINVPTCVRAPIKVQQIPLWHSLRWQNTQVGRQSPNVTYFHFPWHFDPHEYWFKKPFTKSIYWAFYLWCIFLELHMKLEEATLNNFALNILWLAVAFWATGTSKRKSFKISAYVVLLRVKIYQIYKGPVWRSSFSEKWKCDFILVSKVK